MRSFISWLSAGALAIALLAGCSTAIPFSDVPIAECRGAATLDRDTGQRFDTEARDRPSKAPIVKVIEFNDDGELADRCDYSEVLTEIREPPRKNGRRIDPQRPSEPAKMVVLYVHGWKHDASPGDSDLAHFREFVERLTGQEKSTGRARDVVGVFIGWPGALIDVPILEEFTFWGRKRAADRVAQAAYLSKLIGAIGNILCQRGNSNDSFIAIGHSFGARILFAATGQVILQNLQYAHPGVTGGTYKTVRGPTDLVVLLNPAFEAALYTAFDTSRRWQERFDPRQQPLLVSIASTGDAATRVFFPIGQRIDLQWHERQRFTLGNYVPYITHDLARLPEAIAADSAISWYDGHCQDTVCLKRRAQGERDQPGNPFIIAQTTPDLIRDHNDIWGVAFQKWLTGFVETLEKARVTTASERCRG